MSKQNI